MTRFFVDADGNYLGGFDGAEPPAGAIEVPSPPPHGLDTWNGSAWVPHTPEPTVDELLDADIANANSIAELKAALLGNGPNGVRVMGRR